MRKLANVAVLVSLLLILAACGETKRAAKLPPKPCRITSTRAACQAYLIRSFMKDFKSGQVYTIPRGAKLSPTESCPNRQYPALCNKP